MTILQFNLPEQIALYQQGHRIDPALRDLVETHGACAVIAEHQEAGRPASEIIQIIAHVVFEIEQDTRHGNAAI